MHQRLFKAGDDGVAARAAAAAAFKAKETPLLLQHSRDEQLLTNGCPFCHCRIFLPNTQRIVPSSAGPNELNSFLKNYRLIIFRKSFLDAILWKNLNENSIWHYCCVEKSVKFFDKSVNKRDFLKIINLYRPLILMPLHFHKISWGKYQ